MHTIDASFGMPHLPLRNYLEVTVANPLNGCTQLEEGQRHLETLVVVQRGDCTFAQKVAIVQSTGAIGVLVVNNDDKMITLMVCGVADSCSEITIPALMIDRINGEDFLSEVRWYLSMLEVSHVNSYLLWMDVTNNDASCTRNTANASYRLSF